MDYVSKLKTKYSYMSDDEAQYYIDLAKSRLIDALYPNDMSVSYDTYPIPSRFDMWIIECATEYVERDGMSSLTSYSENGVTYTWDTSGISEGLLKRVTAVVGVVK